MSPKQRASQSERISHPESTEDVPTRQRTAAGGRTMKTVVGVFDSRAAAEHAAERLRASGIRSEQINCLTPGTSPAELDRVPTTEGEQPGEAKVLGAVVGGATGASHGLLGAAVASAVVPGIGPV